MLPITPSKIIRIIENSSESETENTPQKLYLPENDYMEVDDLIKNIENSDASTEETNNINQDSIDPSVNNEINENSTQKNDTQSGEESSDQENINDNTAQKSNADKLLKQERKLHIRDTKKSGQAFYVNKKLREQGVKYMGRSKINQQNEPIYNTERSARGMLAACTASFCLKSTKRHCNIFTEEDRLQNFNEFWRHTWEGRKALVKALIEKFEPARSSNEESPRTVTFKYYLFKTDGKRYPVCQKMFCSTLSMARSTIVSWITEPKKTNTVPETATQNSGEPKKKRKESMKQKDFKEKMAKMEKFLDDIPRTPSHYCRSTTNRVYLERGFYSIRKLYQIYEEGCEEKKALSWTTFLTVFQDKNLSIFHPKKDLCNYCSKFVGDVKQTAHYQENKRAQDEKKKDKEVDFEEHEKDPTIYSMCGDVQSGLPAPHFFVNATYYRSKLICHNYTIYGLKDGKVDCYFWSEDEAGLDADVFITCLLDHLRRKLREQPIIKKIIIYTDSCTGQNKNVKLSNALLHFCIENNVTVEQKYLVVGHTYMEADSVHSMIERQCRKQIIYTPMDYIEKIVSARLKRGTTPYIVHYVKKDFFKSHNNVYYKRIRPGSEKGDPTLANIRALLYEPTGVISFKLSFLDEYKPLPHILPSPKLKPPTRLYKKKPGITAAKKKHLQELLEYMPEYAQTFFKSVIK